MRADTPEALAAAIAAQPGLAHTKPALHDVPLHVNRWMQPSGGLSGRRVLDFGCGAGLTAAGIALAYGPEVVYGVDPGLPDEVPGVLGALGLAMPGNLRLKRQARLTDLPDIGFDVIYAWSSLRLLYPAQLAEAIAALYRATAIGGRVLVQVQGLYFSADGAQLRQHGIGPWEHLTMSRFELREVLFARLGRHSEAALAALDRADNLPRLSATAMAGMFRDAGFHLVDRYATQTAEAPPQTLLDLFQPEALTDNQVILLFSKN